MVCSVCNDRFCQSCAMPIPDDSVLGKDKDGSLNQDYCKFSIM
ncbi:MAG: zinc ribbon domain-containing protein [Candidatus Methanomethylophilaceae archaeon]|nr:zinc ribbon domain-containing protein [Candidatus Methanomethylophilaceae archaeon]